MGRQMLGKELRRELDGEVTIMNGCRPRLDRIYRSGREEASRRAFESLALIEGKKNQYSLGDSVEYSFYGGEMNVDERERLIHI